MKKTWYPVIYMFVLTAFFSSIVIGLAHFTRERVETNRKSAFEKAVLTALSMELPERASSVELHDIFNSRVAPPDGSSAGAYRLLDKETLVGYALPIEGRGFWAPIKGVLGIKPDKKTVAGIAFYEQNETPGLGAEIAKAPFRDQFAGKQFSVGDKPITLKPAGSLLGLNEVHAVTGATQTSTRLEKIINTNVIAWQNAVKDGED